MSDAADAPAASSRPVTTYRLQLRDGLTLDDVVDRGWLAHAADLGVSHLYLSPVLTAVPGSTHGYDGVDPRGVDPALGGDEAFDRLARAAAELGVGLVVDIVPNHMATDPASNPWWWDVLRNGDHSEHAEVFDVDPTHPEPRLRGRIVLPVLDDRYGRVLDAHRLTLRRRERDLVACIDDRPLPLSPGSLGEVLAQIARDADIDELRVLGDAYGHLAEVEDQERPAHQRALDDSLAWVLGEERVAAAVDEHLAKLCEDVDAVHEVLEAQHYRLAYWRAARDLGYRRFFDVNELIGVRVERPAVFDATHVAVRRWVEQGSVQGLRVDHPDGLLDPAGYFEQLRALLGDDGWIVAEKILEHGEQLPPEWPVDGTTGYDVAELLGRWFVDADGLRQLGELRDELVGEAPTGAQLLDEAKRLVLSDMLSADLNRATDAFLRLCESLRRFRDVTRHELHEILREVVVAYPVYRTYVPPGTLAGDRDLALVTTVIGMAQAARPDLDAEVLDLLASILVGRLDGELPEAATVRARVEQLTGPAMAKGKEDTAFYREVRLVSRCEVGADPFASGLESRELHAELQRLQELSPRTMTALSTHDTKRSEDVRARLSVLTERPERWAEVARAAMDRLDELDAEGAVDRRTRYLLLQTLVGAHPLDEERLQAYATKAIREAKDHTAWTRVDEPYEAAVHDLVHAMCTDDLLRRAVDRFVTEEVDAPGRATAISQKVLQLLAPGVPDLYWGSEDWHLRLVDPDNRVAPDLSRLRSVVDELRGGPTVGPEDERAKLAAGVAALDVRRRHAECCTSGGYEPLAVVGEDAGRTLAFRRGEDVAAVVTRRTAHGSLDAATHLELPPGTWTVRLGGDPGRRVEGTVALADLLGGWSAAVLERAA